MTLISKSLRVLFLLACAAPAHASWSHTTVNGNNNTVNSNNQTNTNIKVNVNKQTSFNSNGNQTYAPSFHGHVAAQVPAGSIPVGTPGPFSYMLGSNQTVTGSPAVSAAAAAAAQAFSPAAPGNIWIGYEVPMSAAGIADLTQFTGGELFASFDFATVNSQSIGTVYTIYYGDDLNTGNPMEHTQELTPSAPLAPAPGSATLLGLAGLIGARRRRR